MFIQLVVYPDMAGFQFAFKIFGDGNNPFVQLMGRFVQRILRLLQAAHIQYHIDGVPHVQHLFVYAG